MLAAELAVEMLLTVSPEQGVAAALMRQALLTLAEVVVQQMVVAVTAQAVQVS
jgi:hypothetical protein